MTVARWCLVAVALTGCSSSEAVRVDAGVDAAVAGDVCAPDDAAVGAATASPHPSAAACTADEIDG